MGKRSNFERREVDVHPTPRAAVAPLILYLRASNIRSFAEPCAGDGALDRHLEEFGLRFVYAGVIRSGQDALAFDHYGAADAIITNPPLVARRLARAHHALPEHRADVAADWKDACQGRRSCPTFCTTLVVQRLGHQPGVRHTQGD
jgi:hypothetical protein